jgi:uncharacterized protein (DUF1800 family)
MNTINHLYWRAGFGLSPAQWQERKNWSIQKAVNQLFAEAKNNPPIKTARPSSDKRFRDLSQKEKEALLKQQRQQVAQLNTNWIMRMADPDTSDLLERMTLFWHGHFACRSRTGTLATQQLNTLRKYALGNFRDLLISIARDPSMIRYLNNQQNRKQQPNENFARELMELFTLGRGQYTEQDIKEAARAFTGWSSGLKGEFVFRRNWHDYGSKTFFGKTGNWDGTHIIDMILEKPAAAEFITRKIYRYFVNQQVDENRVQVLANAFYQSNYDIGKLMRMLFTSDWFYAKENMGIKFKSPVELAAGMIRTLDLKLKNEVALIFLQRALGQILFNPPNVAGWAGGASWIDNATLMLRLNLAQSIVGTTQFNFRTKADLENQQSGGKGRRIEATANTDTIYQLVKNQPESRHLPILAEYLLLQKPTVQTRLIEQFSPAANKQEHLAQQVIRLMSLPEYQLC